jgi:primosomal protein N' (replication factor Y)
MNNPRPCYLQIAIDTPLNAVFDYRWTCDGDQRPQVGQLALVPFARREVVGLIVGVADDTDVPVDKLKDALAVRSQLSPLSAKWLALAGFAADYYQRPLGEVALPGLPKNLRVLTTVALDRAIKKLAKLDVPHDGARQHAGAERGAAAGGGCHRRRPGLHAVAAVRRHRQRQDRGLSASLRPGAGARAGWPDPDPGAGN